MYAQPDLPAVGPLGGGLAATNAAGMGSDSGMMGGGMTGGPGMMGGGPGSGGPAMGGPGKK